MGHKSLLYDIIENEPIVDACYDVVEMCFDYVWFIQVYTDGADAEPSVTIEASNDNIHWDVWSDCMCKVPVCDGSVSFKDHYFGAKYIRICVCAEEATTGTISANINLKTV